MRSEIAKASAKGDVEVKAEQARLAMENADKALSESKTDLDNATHVCVPHPLPIAEKQTRPCTQSL